MNTKPVNASYSTDPLEAHLSVIRVNAALRPAVLQLQVADAQQGFVVAPRDNLHDIEADACSEARAVVLGRAVIGFYRLDFHPLAIAERPFPAPSCGLRSFLIDACHQGRGYGRAALLALIHDVHARHPSVRTLNLTVNCRNAPARRLYLSVGFEDAGALYLGGPNGPQHVMTYDLTHGRSTPA